MTILSREALLSASDLTEREVDLPSIGGSVRVRSLPAAYSNQAQSDATEIKTGTRGEQTITVDHVKLEALQVLHGLVDPKLASLQDAYTLSQHLGPAWDDIVRAIAEISGISTQEVERVEAAFQPRGQSEAGVLVGDESPAGGGGPDLPVPASA